MKHAYLIIAHNNQNILNKLLKLLDDKRNDIYLCIDSKSRILNIKNIKEQIKISELFIINESIHWGEYSLINATLSLLKEATKKEYSYYHLLSGVDMPLKNQDYIHNFFDRNNGKEFVHFCGDYIKKDIENRIKYYHPLVKINRFKKSWILFKLDKLGMLLQKVFGINRLKKTDLKVYFGSNWFSITNDFAKYIVNNEKLIKHLFNYGFCADELFLQTLLMKSDFKNHLFYNGFDGKYSGNMRVIDWSRGCPYTFRSEDFNSLIDSEYLFARKFDENTDIEIVNRIFDFLKEKK